MIDETETVLGSLAADTIHEWMPRRPVEFEGQRLALELKPEPNVLVYAMEGERTRFFRIEVCVDEIFDPELWRKCSDD